MKALLLGLTMATSSIAVDLRWSQLKQIPDAEGFAGPFAGVSGDGLLVAGGANVTARRWEKDFVKTWHDHVWVLPQPGGDWLRAGTLPRPLGYGASVSVDDSVWCLGGSNAERHFASGFTLRWKDGRLSTSPVPDLPRSCANMCWALVNRTIYVAGGIETPTATDALRTFWALDLDAKELRWQELEPWPGPGRIFGVAASLNGSFYLMSGASLRADENGKAVRTFLRDAYRFIPGRGWEKLVDLPRAAVAAPSPAPVMNGRILVMTGDDGLNVTFEPVEKHPGFPRDILAFDPIEGAWITSLDAPFSRATVPVTEWRGRFVIPNGEVRPRVRTPEVWVLEP